MQTKICSKCKTIKSIDNFHKNTSRKNNIQSVCKECKKEYYEKNKDKIIQQRMNRYHNNKDKEKKYYSINKDKILIYAHDYYQENIHKIKKYLKSPSGIASSFKCRSKRRSKIKEDKISISDIILIKKNAKECYWCRKSIKNKKIHLDHYIPIKLGGRNIIENIVVSCQKCNQIKSYKDPMIYAMSIGRLL